MVKLKCVWCGKIHTSEEWDKITKKILNISNIPTCENAGNIHGRIWYCPSCKEKNDGLGLKQIED